MPDGFRRSITIIERIWLAADQIGSPFVIQVVIEGHGHVDLERLRAAVDRASAANPGSRLVLKGFLRSAYWRDSGITPPVRLVDGRAWDGYGPEHAGFLHDRLSAHGPACEVLLLQGPATRIVFRAHHAVMDARGVYTWAEDVFRALRGEDPLGADSNLTEVDIASAVTDETRPMNPVKSIAPTGEARPGSVGPTWKRLTLEGSYPKILSGKIGWAVARAARKHGSGDVRLSIPVDLRPRRPGLRSTGNICMALHIDVPEHATPNSINHDIWRQLRNKHDCMFFEGGTFLDLVPLRFLTWALKWICRRKQRLNAYDFSALISHLGTIDTRLFSGGGFHADTTFVVPPCAEGIPAFIVLAGTPERLEITASVPPSLAGDCRVDHLLEQIRQVLLPASVSILLEFQGLPRCNEIPAPCCESVPLGLFERNQRVNDL